jgi:hypothetical protein
MIDERDKPVIRKDLVWREVDGEVVIISPDNKSMHTLNDVGSRIWTFLDGENNLADILAVLSAEYEGTGDAAKKDLVEYLENLRQLNLLEE